MVSKIAVIALVAIVAAPIMLGYALNMNEVTATEYQLSGDPVNVTQLLKNDVIYSRAHGDITQLNTNYGGYSIGWKPIFNSISTVKSSYPLSIDKYTNQTWSGTSISLDYNYFYAQFNYDPLNNSHTAVLYGMVNNVEQSIATVQNIAAVSYQKDTQQYSYYYYNVSGGSFTYVGNSGAAELTRMVLTTVTGTSDLTIEHDDSDSYVNLSGGFYFERMNLVNNGVYFPKDTISAIITLNLDSITDSTYQSYIDVNGNHMYSLRKNIVDGDVHWYLNNLEQYHYIDLYYDQNRNDNTYQIIFDKQIKDYDGSTYTFQYNNEIRYVGSWPTIIGEANYYVKYEDSFTSDWQQYGDVLNNITLTTSNTSTLVPVQMVRTLTMRVDDSLSKAFEIPVMMDETYDPIKFKQNPSTKITDISRYGTSITFAGETYTVTDGNITIGTRDFSVKNMVFESTVIPTGYENKINGYKVSETTGLTNHPTIILNGIWDANITTDSRVAETVTQTQWIAGDFAWDGIDSNFLMVGLLAALGAFIALGVYSRRSKASVWPLMLVAGGAAFLFLIMM